MSAAEDILDRVVAWAAREGNVGRLLLVGSRARAARPDDLADIDLQIYTRTRAIYTGDSQWLSEIGDVWLCVRDEYLDGEVRVPTRLVIFAGGVKVDFAFYPDGILSNGVRSGLVHQTLVDKDPAGRQGEAPIVPAEESGRPTQAEFHRVVEEFWFEAYHVAKYLARNELWLAKSRDWAMKQFLLAMIHWHEQLARGRVLEPDTAGRRTSVSATTWQALQELFAGFGREESWEAAFATMRLFRRLGTETAAALGFAYPVDVDKHIYNFIAAVRASRGS